MDRAGAVAKGKLLECPVNITQEEFDAESARKGGRLNQLAIQGVASLRRTSESICPCL
jgi:hypothetical protein